MDITSNTDLHKKVFPKELVHMVITEGTTINSDSERIS